MIVRFFAALALVGAGCAWFDDGPPTRACATDRDCFTAQGEYCEPMARECMQRDAAAAAPSEAP